MWHRLGAGRGDRHMVVLPYRDRLVLLSRYVQQFVMESLGKRLDRAGNLVNQGLTVYGNKGRPTSTPTCSSCATDDLTSSYVCIGGRRCKRRGR